MILPFSEILSGHDASQIFRDAFGKAKNIDIMALSCRFPIHNYGKKYFLDKILDTHTRIRILVVDTKSTLLTKRLEDEDSIKEIAEIKSHINETFKFFQEIKDEISKNAHLHSQDIGQIQLRSHFEIPYRGYSRFDAECFITPYLSNNDALRGPILRIAGNKSQLFAGYRNQFNIFWERAKNNKRIDIGVNPSDEEKNIVNQ